MFTSNDVSHFRTPAVRGDHEPYTTHNSEVYTSTFNYNINSYIDSGLKEVSIQSLDDLVNERHCYEIWRHLYGNTHERLCELLRLVETFKYSPMFMYDGGVNKQQITDMIVDMLQDTDFNEFMKGKQTPSSE